MANNCIDIVTFNCRGFKERNYNYIWKLYEKCDFLLLQETWLYNCQVKNIVDVLPGSVCHAISSMDDSDNGRIGRPYGGVAIVWNRSLPFFLQPVQTINPRIAAIAITKNYYKIILINVYMPTDSGTVASMMEFCDVLNKISSIIDLYKSYQCIIGGDFNVNFSKSNSLNLTAMKSFLDMESLMCCTLKYCLDSAFTYESPDSIRSIIDHFLCFETFDVAKYEILVDGTNLSDHNPVKIKFNCMINLDYNNEM